MSGMFANIAKEVAALKTVPRLSASADWIACPGRLTLDPGEDRSGVSAREGTCAHAVAAAMLAFPAELDYIIPAMAKSVDIELTDSQMKEMKDHVRGYLDYIESIEHTERYIEKCVSLPTLGLSGTSDAILWDEPTRSLHIVDLKYGAGNRVNPVRNSQEMLYGQAAMETLGYEPLQVTLHIYQPRMNNITHWTIPPSVLLDHTRKAHSALLDAVSDAPPFQADANAQCRWCPAKQSCPALREVHNKAVALAVARKDAKQGESETDLFKAILPMLEEVQMLIDDALVWERERLEQGGDPDLYELKPKRATTKWKATEEELKQRFGDAIVTESVLSPAQAKKQLKLDPITFEELTNTASSGYNIKRIPKR